MKRVFVLLAVISCFLILPKSAFAKDYYFPKVEAKYNINSDGSVNVLEKRTYFFDGSFSWADIKIPLKVIRKGYTYKSTIKNFKVSENGKELYYAPNSIGDTFDAKWNYSAINEQRTFVFSYTLENAIGGGTDFSELYWQVIGDSWDKRIGQAEFIINFPENIPRDQVYVFAHGPINGKFDFISDNSVQFSVSDIPPKQFVEVRLVFPKNHVQSTVSSDNNLQEILAEEKSYVSPLQYKQYIFYGLVLVNIFWAVYWIYAWFKYGREYDHDIPQYLHDPPSNLAPALVEILLSQGNIVSTKSFISTLFDLANRKYLIISDRRVLKKRFLLGTSSEHEYAIILKKTRGEFAKDTNLRKYEKLFIGEMANNLSNWTDDEKEAFGIKNELYAFKFSDIKNSFKKPSFYSFWQEFEKEIKKEAKTLGFLEQASETRHNYFVATFLIIVVIDAVALFLLDASRVITFIGPMLLWGFLIGIRLLAIIIRLVNGKKSPNILGFMKRWSLTYGAEAKKWQAFKNFLGDLGHFQNKMPHDLVLWERFLVYGALFGFTEKILKLTPIVLGETTIPSWYVGSSGSFNTFSDFSSSISHFSSNLNSGFSAGSGGSFSGGGGGGGGGAG